MLQGAKNHVVVKPDANKKTALNKIVDAAFGVAGQLCMTLSTAVLLGEARSWLPELVEHAKALRVNAGTTPATPPFASPAIPKRALWFSGHPCRPNLTSCRPLCFKFAGERAVESVMLQICGPDLNGGF